MIKAHKLIMKKNRCEAHWASGPNDARCTQVAKYQIGDFYYCTTHAKIRALKVILDA